MTEFTSLREPHCDQDVGAVVETNGQRIVRCFVCDAYAYTQPRHEAGLAPRKVKTREPIAAGLRMRILERDNFTCVGCHRNDVPLHIGHLVSVKDGTYLGMTEAELADELNLAAMCDACNLGLGSKSAAPRFVFMAVRAAIKHRDGWEQGELDASA